MQAVQVLLVSRERLNKEKSSSLNINSDSGTKVTESQEIDPVQVSFNFLVVRLIKASWNIMSMNNDMTTIYDLGVFGMLRPSRPKFLFITTVYFFFL